MRTGTSGDAVADLQRRLRDLGHAIGEDPAATFGPFTEVAVRAFQARRGLRCDGICGGETWASLVDAGHRLGDRLLYERVPMLRGDDIAELQRLLGGLGFNADRVDGFFGPHTATAVMEFQRNVGLPTDAVCGPETVEALRRVVGRGGEGSTIARLREADAMRRSPPGLDGRRVAIAEGGEAAGLADALGLALRGAGAVVTVIHHPDDSERADAANAFDATVLVGITVSAQPGVAVAFYAREGYESVGGRRLADMVLETLPDKLLGPEAVAPRGMRLPILRETRMPAVVVEVGPPPAAVRYAPLLVEGLAAAVTRWATEPLD